MSLVDCASPITKLTSVPGRAVWTVLPYRALKPTFTLAPTPTARAAGAAQTRVSIRPVQARITIHSRHALPETHVQLRQQFTRNGLTCCLEHPQTEAGTEACGLDTCCVSRVYAVTPLDTMLHYSLVHCGHPSPMQQKPLTRNSEGVTRKAPNCKQMWPRARRHTHARSRTCTPCGPWMPRGPWMPGWPAAHHTHGSECKAQDREAARR